jgi:DNA-binding MarR family transcriptional regulator
VPEESLGFLMADISRLMRRAFEQRLEGPLTLAKARALVFVASHEGIRQVDLAELLNVQPITLARLLDQLEGAGLVERRPDPDDRRAHQIFLQPAAASHLEVIGKVVVGIRADALRDMDEGQTALVIQALRRMRANLAVPVKNKSESVSP